MRSLATNALKVVNSKDTLREVVEKCKESPLLVNACSQSADFWKDTLTRLHGTVGTQMILQRGDLITGAEWQLFCEGLVKGFAFRYILNEDSVVKPRYAGRFDGDEWSYDFTIDGVLPLPETNSIAVDLDMEAGGEVRSLGTEALFAPTVDECIINLSQWLFDKTVRGSDRFAMMINGETKMFEAGWESPEVHDVTFRAIVENVVAALNDDIHFQIDNIENGETYFIQVKHFIFQ